jgi:hypothetical protein
VWFVTEVTTSFHAAALTVSTPVIVVVKFTYYFLFKDSYGVLIVSSRTYYPSKGTIGNWITI